MAFEEQLRICLNEKIDLYDRFDEMSTWDENTSTTFIISTGYKSKSKSGQRGGGGVSCSK
jgi:hypothetical protein